MLTVQQYLLMLLATCYCAQVTEANIYFRFAFHVGPRDLDESNNSTELLDLTKNSSSVENSEILKNELQDMTTVVPTIAEVWSRQESLNAVAVDKLQLIKEAITNINLEILPLVGRSAYISAKAKLTTGYLNDLDTTVGQQKFQHLRNFVQLVDELQQAPSAEQGGKRSLEFLLMRLVLDKYDVLKLQTDVREEVLQAEQAWQKYVKSKLIDVTA